MKWHLSSSIKVIHDAKSIVTKLSGAGTFFEQRGGGRKYKFRFASKFAKHLHQPVISKRVGSCTFWGAEHPALGDFVGFTTKIIHF